MSPNLSGASALYLGDTPVVKAYLGATEVFTALDPLLAEAVLLLRASAFTGATGDDWSNEGTGGAALNAVCDNTVDGIAAGTPVFVTSPIPGFELGDGSSGTAGSGPYYSIAHSALLDPGAGSFTAFAYITWPTESGPAEFSNVCSKIDTSGGQMGSGGTGWQMIDSPFTSGAASIMGDGGGIGSGTILATSGAGMTVGTHVLACRLDRDTDLAHVFVDGVKSANVDASAVGSVTAAHELIFGRGDHAHVAHAYGYWDRALTDLEVASLSDLLAA